ncbi:MAG: hypothetical protein KJ043_07405 [Anaerolineae bacterium]|nr:hypothetical protein [Anaerolineae bacterium]
MKTVYDVVIHLVGQLSLEEQRRLTDYLLHLPQVDDDKITWKKHFDDLIDTTPMLTDFSNRREDWYDDDGR